MTYSATEVFCDYLKVSYSPSDSPDLDVSLLLQSLGAYCSFEERGVRVLKLDGGTCSFAARRMYSAISLSGRALAYLRTVKQFDQVLSLLASAPHRVTRMDVTLDVPGDSAPVLRKLRRKYPRSVQLTRKSVATKFILSSRFDGVESGSFYGGPRAAPVASCVVYDKANEQFERTGEVGPLRTRYEIRLGRKSGASLRDAASPAPVFFHFASPALLMKPSQVPPWEPSQSPGWESDYSPPVPYQVLKSRVEGCPDFDALCDLADQCGPHGRLMLARMLVRRVLGKSAAVVLE